MSKIIGQVQAARAQGRLAKRFRAADVRQACPGWAPNTYRVFLPKHCEGNPRGETAYFTRHSRGSYSLLPQFDTRGDDG